MKKLFAIELNIPTTIKQKKHKRRGRSYVLMLSSCDICQSNDSQVHYIKFHGIRLDHWQKHLVETIKYCKHLYISRSRKKIIHFITSIFWQQALTTKGFQYIVTIRYNMEYPTLRSVLGTICYNCWYHSSFIVESKRWTIK